jgi:hypothetical protein
MTSTIHIDVYDVIRAEWRCFPVQPGDHFEPACKNGLHQLAPSAGRCACGSIAR